LVQQTKLTPLLKKKSNHPETGTIMFLVFPPIKEFRIKTGLRENNDTTRNKPDEMKLEKGRPA